jgi:hypothetical protein
MSKKTRPKKQVTPERLQQLGFAYAPPLIHQRSSLKQSFRHAGERRENGRASQ